MIRAAASLLTDTDQQQHFHRPHESSRPPPWTGSTGAVMNRTARNLKTNPTAVAADEEVVVVAAPAANIDYNNNDDDRTEESALLAASRERPFVIAYAASISKCAGDDVQQTPSADLMDDAALILRHSIHQISVRNPQSDSRYDYKMYAIVHRQAGKP
jgi:hypothetical protein